jgi:hypothetical protein
MTVVGFILGALLTLMLCLWTLSYIIPANARPNQLGAIVMGAFFIMAFVITFRLSRQFREKVIIENGELILKDWYIRWRIPIQEISQIDDQQGKYDLTESSRESWWILARNYSVSIGFRVMTEDNKNYLVLYPIKDYRQLLSQLQSLNPHIQLGKVTEAMNEQYGVNLRKNVGWFLLAVFAGVALAAYFIIVSIRQAMNP